MNRFSEGLGGLKKAAGKSAAAAPAPAIEKAASQDEATGLPPSRKGKVAIAAYFDPAVRKQLAILAVQQDKSQAALLAEALNMMFERYGEPPIASA